MPGTLEFEYICDKCGVIKTNKEMDSMVCECGGDFKSTWGVNQIEFKPYFNESHGVQVNSASEHRAFVKQHGAPLGDYPKMMARQKFVRKNREDIIADRYAKIGLKYPRGKKVLLDEKNMRFVPRH